MLSKFYVNPSLFHIVNGDEHQIQIGLKYRKKLDSQRHAAFIEYLEKNRQKELSLKTLMNSFTDEEINELFKEKAIIDYSLDLTSRTSRSDCFFIFNNCDISKLEGKNVLILGAGALGTHMLWLFGTTNIKKITVVDFDSVELSNLNRQCYYDEYDIDKSKIEVLNEKFTKQNSNIDFKSIEMKIASQNDLNSLLSEVNPDLLVSAIDTPVAVHSWINKVCVQMEIPYVSGGFIADKGVLGPTFIPNRTDCYECLYPDRLDSNLIKSGMGSTFSGVVEYVASCLFLESIKILTEDVKNISYGSKILLYDWISNQTEEVKLKVATHCPTCGRLHGEIKKYTLNFSVVKYVYFLGTFLIPAVNLYIGNNVLFTIIALLTMNAIPLCFKKQKYKVAFIGSILYIINIIQFTVITNNNTFSLGVNNVSEGYMLLTIIFTMVSISNIIFLGIVFIYDLFLEQINQLKDQVMKVIRLD